MAGNGALPASQLARIPGSGPYGGPHLRRDAARAYTALHRYSMHRWGISMALVEGDIGRSYRSYARQQIARRYWCGLGKCGNAAVPGTSNHGLGTTVDLMTRQQRWVIDQVGHLFGFSKRWSDASWEWWHIKYLPGNYPMVAKWAGPTVPVLKRGARGKNVITLKKLLYKKGIRGFSAGKNGKPSSNRYDDHFGANCQAAVKRFQKKKGLKADGVVGPATWRKLRA